MKNLLLFTPLLCLVFTGPADATHCYSQAYVAPVQSYGYSYKAVAATYYAPVYYPVYSIGNNSLAGDSLKDTLLQLNKELANGYKEKSELLQWQVQQLQQQLQGGPGAPQAKPQTVSKAIGVFVQSCAKCHSEDRAKDSGGGFILLRGGSIDHLTAADRLEIIRRTISDDPKIKMPKGGSLPDPDVVAIVQEMSGNGPPQVKGK